MEALSVEIIGKYLRTVNSTWCRQQKMRQTECITMAMSKDQHQHEVTKNRYFGFESTAAIDYFVNASDPS